MKDFGDVYIARSRYSKLNTKDDVDTPAARALAQEAAEQSMVLRESPSQSLLERLGHQAPESCFERLLAITVMNHDETLPLQRSSTKRLALIGPNANATKTMQGNYATSKPPLLVSPVEGFEALGIHVEYVEGCGVASPVKPAEIAAAVAAAKAADAVVVVAGLDATQESEGHDRSSLLLPAGQLTLIEAVAAAASAPIVLLLMSGSALDVASLVRNPKVGAIMWVGYPGQAGGIAIAEAVLGVTAVAGRSPMTWYFANYTSQVNKTQMDLRPSSATGYPGRTHRFVSEPVLFPFGAGLHYSSFTTQLESQATVSLADAEAELEKTHNVPHLAQTIVTPKVTLKNTGLIQSDFTVLLFLSPPNAGQRGRPLQQLRQFERVATTAGGAHEVELPLTCHDFALAGEDGALAIAPGAWKLRVDGSETVVHVQ